jgi:hypothetical protein
MDSIVNECLKSKRCEIAYSAVNECLKSKRCETASCIMFSIALSVN